MSYLYLLLDILALSGPLMLSFDKRVRFVQHWKTVIPATLLMAIPFIAFDMYFTSEGVWGFDPSYLSGINLGNLPLEEVLFFLVIPFACAFIYECCKSYFYRLRLSLFNRIFVIVFIIYLFALLYLNPTGYYTIFITATGLTAAIIMKKNHYKFLPISLVLNLIPFFIFNGILTGIATSNPVVWYNENHFSGVRISTIPAEDIIYGFSLIVFVIVIHEKLNKRIHAKASIA